jgi:hypothetical protein
MSRQTDMIEANSRFLHLCERTYICIMMYRVPPHTVCPLVKPQAHKLSLFAVLDSILVFCYEYLISDHAQ